MAFVFLFFCSSRRRHTRCALVTGVQTCALPICALAHFDHALDASLVVSYLALRQGDAVGLYATGGDERWVAPQRSLGAIDTLLRASYDLQPQPVATDYLAAATGLSLRQQIGRAHV